MMLGLSETYCLILSLQFFPIRLGFDHGSCETLTSCRIGRIDSSLEHKSIAGTNVNVSTIILLTSTAKLDIQFSDQVIIQPSEWYCGFVSELSDFKEENQLHFQGDKNVLILQQIGGTSPQVTFQMVHCTCSFIKLPRLGFTALIFFFENPHLCSALSCSAS